MSFPQSHDCGLIEVDGIGDDDDRPTAFPQSHDCGLIEVIGSISIKPGSRAFRSLTTAA